MKNLQIARELTGKTQEEVAKILGITRASISNMERDSTNVGGKYILKFCEIYNVDPNFLFGFQTTYEILDMRHQNKIKSIREAIELKKVKLKNEIAKMESKIEELEDKTVFLNNQKA